MSHADRPRRTRRSNNKVQEKEQEHSDEDISDDQGDFQDSGSEATLPESSDSESSAEEFQDENVSNRKSKTPVASKPRKSSLPRALKLLHSKKETIKYSNIIKKSDVVDDNPEDESENFSVKDLTEQEKQLPNFLDLSESGKFNFHIFVCRLYIN